MSRPRAARRISVGESVSVSAAGRAAVWGTYLAAHAACPAAALACAEGPWEASRGVVWVPCALLYAESASSWVSMLSRGEVPMYGEALVEEDEEGEALPAGEAVWLLYAIAVAGDKELR